MKKESVRLPSYIQPKKYNLFLQPDMENFTYAGEESIFLNLGKTVKSITLHTKDLEILSVEYVSGKKEIWAGKISYNTKDETATFTFLKNLPKGAGELKLIFRGLLTDKLKGFYKSSYMHEGKQKHIATTQFEPTDARRAFPCFDEPAQKAVFDVSIKIPKHLTAISNTIESSILEHEGGFKVVNFESSPKMSTYLLAFIIGDFEFIEGKTKRGVRVRIFTTKGKKHQAKFALDTAIRSLDFYENYFAVNYPLPILDLIALPDFASAAMENWGAITYRETALLVDEQHTSSANKQWVAIVINHEIAHQWFGNLVTMDWWTDLWLNEGFASYMEHLATHELFPNWQIWEQYVSGRFASALKLDALENTHPIEVQVHHPNEISEIFDMVSYAKGSAVIRMLAEYIGAKDFRDGLRHYLKRHAYKNTVTEDLWKSFEQISKKPVRKLMHGWTQKPGYPVVSVELNDGKIKLEQKRFFSSEASAKNSKDKTVWQIPVSVFGENGKSKSLVTTKSTVVKANGRGWVKINRGETSFFRTKYTAEMLNSLKPAVVNGKLPLIDRLGLIRDAFALAEAGQGSTVNALILASFYQNEQALAVWEELAAGVASAGTFYKGENWYPLYEQYGQKLFAKLTKQLGWKKGKGESHTTGLLRTLALAQSASFGNKEIIAECKKLFAAHIKGKHIPADLRGVVYNIVAQNGGEKEFKQFVKLHSEAGQMHEEQDRLGRAMGSFKNKAVLKKVLQFALSKNVRVQDAPSIFIGVARNFYGCHLAWQYLKDNWETIFGRYNAGGHLLEWFIVAFSRFNTTAEAKDVAQFFKTHPAPTISRTVAQVLERIYSNEAWVKRDGKKLKLGLKVMFKLFQNYPLIFGISNKADGNMRLDGNGTEENRSRFFKDNSLSPKKIYAAHLVHGTTVHKIEKSDTLTIAQSDALISGDSNCLLTITVADCFPVYFFYPKKKVVGLAHCGWRGIIGGIVENTIKAMESNPADLLVGIGPGIQACHFEIKEDVFPKFLEHSNAIVQGDGKIFVDLPKIIISQLQTMGITQIENLGECTYGLAEKYFSFRRDKPEVPEAMVAYIGLLP